MAGGGNRALAVIGRLRAGRLERSATANMTSAYAEFLDVKMHLGDGSGFAVEELPTFLYPFQDALVRWALKQGRAAILADCGLGKTPMQLVWADQVARHTDGRVLILTPLA